MRIAALSDLHIGSSGRVDSFRHGEDAFLRFLDGLESSHDRIVLLGDVFQTDHSLRVGARAAVDHLSRAQARVPALWQRFKQAPYVYVHGNHDEISRDVCGARSHWRSDFDGFSLYFVHGHQFDPLLRRMFPVARAATWLSGCFRRTGLSPVAEWLEHQDIAQKHERFGGDDGPYARAARALLNRERVQAVIMGHTHVPQIRQLPEGLLANTGSCSRGRLSWLSIDCGRRTIRLEPAPLR